MLGWRVLRALWPSPMEEDFSGRAARHAGAPTTFEARACPQAAGSADAPLWDCDALAARAYEPVLGTLLADMRGQIVALCQHLGVRRVLDVCCGPGGLTRRLAEAGMDVCGVDLAWPMLRQARRHCEASRSASPLFVRADATNLPFASTVSCSTDATSLPFASTVTCPTDATSLPFASTASCFTDTPNLPFASTVSCSTDATSLPFAAPSFDAAVLVLALHTMPPAVGRAAVADMLRVAPYCIVADYRLAERNCDLPAVALGRAVEWLVGGEHYSCYKAFMAAGALEGFAHSHGYAPVERRRMLGGAGSIIVLERAKAERL